MTDPTARPPSTLTLGDGDLALATDLYQLTMAAAYHALGDGGDSPERATFELWVRRFPRNRCFLVLAGVEQALASLAAMRFRGEQIDYLRGLDAFAAVPQSFFDRLAAFRFRGGVAAMAEGTIFFPGEPVLRVTGSLFEAQIVETLLLSIVNFQTLIASKAARLRLAARLRPADGRRSVAEFGGRRAHGPQAALWAARAAYIGGVDSTSNVLAGQRLGIPVVGTMAHSYVMSFRREVDAFRHYQSVYPDHAVHLVDTYDSLEGVRQALATDRPFAGIRLDSGDLLELSRAARRILDQGGCTDARIFASGDLDERKIEALLAAGAPIDAFGVGTELSTSFDAPALSGVYKLVETRVDGERRLTHKKSAGKATYPGAKQVLRRLGEDGTMAGDRVLPLESAAAAARPGESPLLHEAFRAGEALAGAGLAAARERCLAGLERLPAAQRRLDGDGEPFPVHFDPIFEERSG